MNYTRAHTYKQNTINAGKNTADFVARQPLLDTEVYIQIVMESAVQK